MRRLGVEPPTGRYASRSCTATTRGCSATSTGRCHRGRDRRRPQGLGERAHRDRRTRDGQGRGVRSEHELPYGMRVSNGWSAESANHSGHRERTAQRDTDSGDRPRGRRTRRDLRPGRGGRGYNPAAEHAHSRVHDDIAPPPGRAVRSPRRRAGSLSRSFRHRWTDDAVRRRAGRRLDVRMSSGSRSAPYMHPRRASVTTVALGAHS